MCRWTAWKAQTSEEGCQLLGAGISGETVMRLALQILEKLRTGYSSCHRKEWLLPGGMRTNKKEQVPFPSSSLSLFHSQGDTGKAGTGAQGPALALECGEAGL